MLQFTGSQRNAHDLGSEQKQKPYHIQTLKTKDKEKIHVTYRGTNTCYLRITVDLMRNHRNMKINI